MPGFFALGTGFVNAAVKEQEDSKDERRKNRQMAMEVWVKDTLPRVRAAQAKDNEFASSINGMMNDEYYKGNPALAFYSKKWQDRTGKSEMDFRNYAASNKLPEEVKTAAQNELQKHFNIDPTSGQVAWKTQAPQVASEVPDRSAQPNFYQKIMGKGQLQNDVKQGVDQAAAMTGVDPNAATTARSDTMSIPGSFQSRDLEAEKRADTAFTIMARDPNSIKNFDDFVKEYTTNGSAAALKKLSFIPPEVRREQEFTSGLREKMTAAILQNLPDLKDPTGSLAALAKGNFTINTISDVLSKGMRTPEEKAQLGAELKAKYEMPNSEIDWITLMADSDRFAKLFPDQATRKALEESVTQFISGKRLDAQQKMLMSVAGPGAAAMANPSEVNVTSAEDIRKQAAQPKEPTPESINTATEAINSEDGLTLRTKKAAAAPTDDEKTLDDLAAAAVPETIKSYNDPVKLLKAAAKRTTQGKEGSMENLVTIAENVRITPQIAARIMDDEDYGNQWNSLMEQYVEPHLKEFGSMKDAQDAGLEPYSLAIINGNIKIVPPKKN